MYVLFPFCHNVFYYYLERSLYLSGRSKHHKWGSKICIYYILLTPWFVLLYLQAKLLLVMLMLNLASFFRDWSNYRILATVQQQGEQMVQHGCKRTCLVCKKKDECKTFHTIMITIIYYKHSHWIISIFATLTGRTAAKPFITTLLL